MSRLGQWEAAPRLQPSQFIAVGIKIFTQDPAATFIAAAISIFISSAHPDLFL